jgi:hypothetical protein
MSPSQDIVTPRFELRINGIADPPIRFRMSDQEPDDFDVLVEDAFLGTLTVTDDCLVELREAGAEWRLVSLDRLKDMIVKDRELFVTEDLPNASVTFERKPINHLDEVDVRRRPLTRLGDITGHSDCRKRVQALFYRAHVPHKSAGTVFFVPDLRQAQKLLSDAGFYPSPYAPTALVEPETRCAIQLIEEPV